MSVTSRENHAFVNGIDVYYEEYQSIDCAPVFLLIHGFLSSSFSFRKLIPLLVKEFHVISIDIPPFGKSGKSKNYRYSYKNMAKTVIDLLDHLSIDSMYAAGHSMGGQILMNIMHQRPDFIKKTVLLCSSAYMPKANNPMIFSSYLPLFDRYIKRYLQKTGVVGNLENVVFDKSMINETMINGYTEPFNNDLIFSALTKLIRHREGDLTETVLRKIHTPCLLIWGEQDKIVPLHIGKRLANDLPHSKFVIFKNAGHLIPEEMPMDVYVEIRKFILGGVKHD
ncbi:alpha/beta fold hydrolase [Bacillus sp. FSL K6-3431]|uniref:alpha/beta fold hydrolase n=1 Tax=Bacillus sp. FSL K6-3431 TaxID=2921500 RepID=UPI0030F95941